MDIALVFANSLARAGAKTPIVALGEPIAPICLRLAIALAAYGVLLIGMSLAAGH